MDARRFGFIIGVIALIFGAAVALGYGRYPAAVILISMLATTIRVSTPLVLGALSGIFCERSGVVNIAIEGMMLTAAFTGFTASLYIYDAGAPGMVALLLGVLVAILSGALLGLLHAVLSITYKTDQIISGTVINILAVGITGYLNRQLFFGGQMPHSPGVLPRISLPVLSELPLVGSIFSQQPITWLAPLLVLAVHILLFHTVWGLRTRAVGEHPRGADTLGIDVIRMRYINVILGGAMAGLAGAYFTLESVPAFEPLMTNGRGFISLAAMIFGNWTPFGAWAATLLFGAAQALQANAQQFEFPAPSQFVGMVPYVMTMLVLTGIVGRTIPPAADGQPYEREALPPRRRTQRPAALPFSADGEILQAVGIVKRFPGVVANDHVNFSLRRGEIHAILGENGAGKTTLMNILYGLYHPDEGEIYVKGQPVELRRPNDAIRLGIGMVHQHFMLVPVFTVAENIILGQEIRRGPFLDLRRAVQEVRELSRRYGLEVDPEALVKDLPVGVQQRVEILKALYRNADILILDEPTAVLTPQETEELFRVMRHLQRQGVSIIFITHKLKEVLAVADRITVLRNGRVVGVLTPEEADEAHLAAMMVGREVMLTVEKAPARPGEEVLRVEDLRVRDDRGALAVDGVSFSVRAGEILGIAGVQGNGQTELIEALVGLRPVAGGRVFLLGEEVTGRPPRALIDRGMAHIPEDRQKHGLVLPYSVADNLVLNAYDRPPFARGLQRQPQAILEHARRLIALYDIRTPSPYTPARNLSGGNQQKVIAARELSRPIRLLVANQPTRGLDVGATEYIHRKIVEMRDQGVAVLLVSTELDEIFSLSDRIAVMYRGRIVAVLEAAEATLQQVGLLMAGVLPAPARTDGERPAARTLAG
jgi:simple sugar transport system ATP-binding protein